METYLSDIDDEPIAGSENLVKSGGIYKFSQQSNETYGAVFDVSEKIDSSYVPVFRKDGSDNFNVSSDTGEFKPTENTKLKSIELQLDANIKTISY